MNLDAVNYRLLPYLFSGAALLVLVVVSDIMGVDTAGDEAPFLAESRTAMTKMMTAMDIKPSGDADADFVAMMVSHHQGTIDLAQAQLHHGRNEQLKRLAQEIIDTQQEEIAAMRLTLGQSLPLSKASPTQPSLIVPVTAFARP